MKTTQLTKREKELFTLLTTTSLSSKDIAKHLGVKEQTIKTHCQNIYYKLCVNNRIDLLVELLNERTN